MSGSIDEPWNPPQDQPQRALPYVGQPRAPQAPSAPPVFRTLPGFEEQPPENNGGGLWDSFGAQFWHDLKEKGSNAVEAGSLMARKLTGNPQIVQYIEGLRHGIDQNIQHQVDNMSPQEQATLRSSLFDPNAPRPGEVGWRNYIGSSLGSLAATLSLFLPAAAASIAAPELAPALAAGMFGTDQMGGAYKKVVDTLDNTPHKQMMANPAYAQRFTELTQQGLTQDQADIRAKQDLAGNVGVLMMGQFALGAAQGVVPGGMLLKGIFGKGLASLGGRLALGSLEGGGVMGGFGAASNALEQAANIQAGPQTQFDPQKLALAAASGFTGGALLGAASGAAHGKAERRETEREETEGTSERPPTTDGQVATDTKQALQEQLQTQPQAAPAAIESGTSPQQPAQAAPTPTAPPTQPATPDRVIPTTEQPVGNSAASVLPQGQESPTSKVDQAAAQAVEPTPAQAEAGNYQKGHLRLQGLDVTIETPKGGIRRGPIDQATGQPQWEATMPAHYGYIRGTRGADGDQVDVTLGPRTGALFNGTPEQAAREPVFVVDQIDPRTQKFDEHKALIGFHTPLEAQRAYDESFSDGSGPQRRRAINEMAFDQFKNWLDKGDTTKPIGKRPRRSVATTKPAESNAGPGADGPVPTWLEHNRVQTVGMAERTGLDQKVRSLHEQGLVAEQIAAKLGIEAADVRAIRDSMGLEQHGPTVAFGGVIIPHETKGDQLHAPDVGRSVEQPAAQAEPTAERGFKTSLGSTYVLHDDGTTTRTKSLHPGHEAADVGKKERSARTIYVDSAAASNLSGAGVTEHGGKGFRLVLKNGKASLLTWNKAKDKWGVSPISRDIPFSETPEVGKAPVEAWKPANDVPGYEAYRGQHAGNPIVEIKGEADSAPRTIEQPANESLTSQTSLPEPRNQNENTPAVPEQTTEERLTEANHRLREAFGASVQKLPKGTDATPYINRMLRELTESIGDTDGSPEEISGALRDWAKGKPHEFADSVLNLMTGEKLGAHRLSEEQIEQGKRQIGTERATRTPVEALADKEGTGTVDYGAEKKRSEKTTNLDRRLKDLEHDILQGLKDPAEAAREFGEHPSAGEHTKNLRAWFKHQLDEERAKPPEDQDTDRIGLLAKTLRKLGGETGARKAAGPSEADRKAAIERLRKAQKRDIAEEKANSVKVKQEDEEPRALGLRRTYTRAARDLHLEDTVRDILMRDHAAGKSSSIHDYLDAIIGSKGINYRLPQAAEFARKLKAGLPKDLQVMSGARATDLYGESFDRPDNLGSYYEGGEDGPELITLNHKSQGGLLETVLHEALHGITSQHMDDLNIFQRHALSHIKEELQRAFDGAEGLTDGERQDIDYALTGDKPGDFHELHTMLMTSPVVQQFAAEHIPSAAFKVEMTRLGYLPGETKTLWKSFVGWTRRAVGLGKEHESLLDWAMRPLTDVIDQAHEKNAAEGRVLPADPALRRAAEPVGDLLRPLARPMRDFTDELPEKSLRWLDAGGKADSVRRGLLFGATTDGIVRWNKSLFESRDKDAPGNSLRAYHAAGEAWAKASKDFRDAHQDTIHDTFNKLRKAPDRDKVAKLLIDSTLNETDASDKDSKLHAEFGRLSAEGKAAFTGMRDVMNRIGKEERDAQWESMVRKVLPNATPDQIKAVRAIGKDHDELTEFLKNIDDNEVAKKFGANWDDAARDLVKGIAKIHARGFVKGLYFPLRRFGDYVVRYGEKGEDNYGVEMFERRSEADARRNELLQQKGLNVSQVMDKREKKMQSMIPGGLPQELEMALNKDPALAKHADAVREMLSSIILQHEARSDLAKSRLQRKGIAGASQDIERVVARNFLSTASRIGYLKHGFDRDEAHAAMLRHADWLGEHGKAREQIRASAVIKEMESRQASGDDASGFLTGLARRASTLGFVQSLMSPSHMLTSTLEAHMNSTSLLTARHGFKANATLTRALMHLAPTMAGASARGTLKAVRSGLRATDWNMSTLMRERLIAKGADRQAMIDLFNRLNAAGLIDHSMIREMQRIAYPGGFSGRTGEVWQRFMDFNSISAHAVDVMNKSAIAKAAYDLELAKTHDHEKALNYAVETARMAMPNYNLQNKNRLSRGLLSPLMQFKQYGFHMYTVMANLAHEAIANGDKEAAKAFAGILATHALIAGSFTLIADPLRYIMGAYDWISGAKQPHDYQADARGWLSDVAGPTVGEMIARGLPYAAGMDIHRRVGLANLLEVPELKSFTSAGFLDVAAQAMTGASGQDAIAMADGLTKLIHGDMRGLLALVPRVVRDPMKAANLANHGVIDSRGRTILPVDQLTAGDEALQAAGFQPARVSEFREGRYAVMQARDEAKDERSQVIQAWVQAGQDADAREEAMEMMRRYNRDHPENRLQVSQLLQAAHRARNAARRGGPGSFGLTLPKKGARQLENAGRFANM